MKKNWIYLLSLAVVSLFGTTACEDDPVIDEPETPVTPDMISGAYIVNTGNWGQNDGSIQWYDLSTGEVSKDIYASENGKGIGDIQDLCVYGSHLYAICPTSSKVEVLTLDGKLVKSLPMNTMDNKPMEPRYATAGNGFVYFTAYDGTVSALDTTSFEVTKSVAVGDHPEALTYANDKLYVNISGYSKENKVAVVDAKSMTKLKDITVKLNPYTQSITGEDGFVYVVSNGNYAGSADVPEDQWIYQTLQRIDPATDTVEDLCNATYIANRGSKMYILYAEYYLPDTHKCFVYDLETKEEKALPIDLGEIASPGFIEVNPDNGDIFIGNQVYGALNDVYVYDSEGQFKTKFETGNYTTKMRFATR